MECRHLDQWVHSGIIWKRLLDSCTKFYLCNLKNRICGILALITCILRRRINCFAWRTTTTNPIIVTLSETVRCIVLLSWWRRRNGIRWRTFRCLLTTASLRYREDLYVIGCLAWWTGMEIIVAAISRYVKQCQRTWICPRRRRVSYKRRRVSYDFFKFFFLQILFRLYYRDGIDGKERRRSFIPSDRSVPSQA